MLRIIQRIVLVGAACMAGYSASAFSLLGPYAPWQTANLSYNAGGIDVGGPMNLGEEYRWNERVITYGFSQSFLDYFGQRGVQEINKAIAVFNNLPPASMMSKTLAEFPQDTRQFNLQAATLTLLDLKSFAMGMLTEELGMAAPERYVWTLRNRFVTLAPATNYWVVMRNFDPVTWTPSAYVNGTLYTYNIVEVGPPLNYSDASESTVDPLAIGFNSVASIVDHGNPGVSPISAGVFFTGLTRDDVGCLRYMLRPSNRNVENPLPDATASTTQSNPWRPVGGGVAVSNAIVTTALRPGIDKLVFREVLYFGRFPGVTNSYVDTFYDPLTGILSSQHLQRVLAPGSQPDILFDAGDLGLDAGSGRPFELSRSDSAGWINNSALVQPGTPVQSGPGVIAPPITISFTTAGPYFLNVFFSPTLDQASATLGFGGWAAFDGTTNAPVIFPNGASIMQLENAILQAGF